MKAPHVLICILFLLSGSELPGQEDAQLHKIKSPYDLSVSLIVLGTIQDAGSPQLGCKKDCCDQLFLNPDPERKVSSLGLVDRENDKSYIFDATPDLGEQLRFLNIFSQKETDIPDGVFITHAHIGHYSGLMYLGMEAAHTNNVSVFVMPRMREFLEKNGPWSQLLIKNNIRIQKLRAEEEIILSDKIKITPLLVPHRDEFSETVGYLITGPGKKALYIPDIDKWSHWDTDIAELIQQVDYAFLDATFYSPEEIPGRDLTQVLHPFVTESMSRFEKLGPKEKDKVYFIHLNHTNPLLNTNSKEYRNVISKGFHIARFGDKFQL